VSAVAPELSDEKNIEYAYQSTIALVGVLITVCFVLAGFAFTGIILFVTSAEPLTLLSQVILFILFLSMEATVFAGLMLHWINLEIAMESPKPIIPIFPNQWPTINAFLIFSVWAIGAVVTLTFLLRNLVILFVVSITAEVVGGIIMNVFYWRPVAQKMRKKGILK
jgi:hypothetical protein